MVFGSGLYSFKISISLFDTSERYANILSSFFRTNPPANGTDSGCSGSLYSTVSLMTVFSPFCSKSWECSHSEKGPLACLSLKCLSL